MAAANKVDGRLSKKMEPFLHTVSSLSTIFSTCFGLELTANIIGEPVRPYSTTLNAMIQNSL
jgi:hypothetical protein